MNRVNYHMRFAIGFNLFLFLLFYYLATPTVYSGENAFIHYQIAGGFGEPPTHYLDYNYGVHPFLTWGIKQLAVYFSSVNWYTCLLLAGYYIALTSILASVLRYVNKPLSFFGIPGIFFSLVFIHYFLLNIEFSGVSVLLTIAGMLHLYLRSRQNDSTHLINYTAILFLIFAALFRIHVMIPVAGLFIPFLFAAGKKAMKYNAINLTIAVAIILLFNYIQVAIYTTHDRNWPKEEAYRSHIYKIYNRHGAIADSSLYLSYKTEIGLIQKGLLIDSQYLSASKISDIYDTVFAKPGKSLNLNFTVLKWGLINNRIYYLSFFFLLLCNILNRNSIKYVLVALLFLLSGLLLLTVFAKIPHYLIPSGFFLLSLMSSIDLINNPIRRKKVLLPVFTFGVLFFIAWGVHRTIENSARNRLNQDHFKIFCQMLNRHSDTLFILPNNDIIQHFNPFDTPKDYPLHNYLDSEFFLNNKYQDVLKKFHIADVAAIPKATNILFVGEIPMPLVDYYQKVHNLKTSIEPLHEFDNSWKIYRLRKNEDTQFHSDIHP